MTDKKMKDDKTKNLLKPGQKFPTPTPGFGDRVFYETLLRQRPHSTMAQEWCVHYGVLSHEEAERVYNLLTSNGKQKRNAGTTSSPSPRKKAKKEPDGVVSSSADL